MLEELIKCCALAELILTKAIVPVREEFALDCGMVQRLFEAAFGRIEPEASEAMMKRVIASIDEYGTSTCVAFDVAHAIYHAAYAPGERRH